MRIISKQEELRVGQTLTLECLAGSSNPKVNISWSVGLLRCVKAVGGKAQWQTVTK